MALKPTPPSLEELADLCLQYLAQNPEQLAEFMVQSGLSPDALRRVIGTHDFVHGIVDYVVSNEPLLLAICAEAKLKPETVTAVWVRHHLTEH